MAKVKSEPTLDVIFDSPVRIRLLKLFLFNSDRNFDGKTIAEILNANIGLIKRHLEKLLETHFIIAKKISNRSFFRTNKNFIFYDELRELIAKSNPASKEKMLKRLKNLGGVKLALLSGIFFPPKADQPLAENSVDLLVVGDKINSAKFDRFLKELESEVGKEINCALMTTKEFNYRHNMYDRFVRDLLDFKHEKLINKLRI